MGERQEIGVHGRVQGKLSEAQLAIWLHEELNPGSTVYHLVHTLELFDIDEDGWRQAVYQSAMSQPAQRTNIVVGADGTPVQVVSDEPNPDQFVLVDGRDFDEAAINRAIAEAADRRIDLETDPLYRLTLIAMPHGSHILVVQAHHIVTDLWSLAAGLDAVAHGHQVACGVEEPRRRRPLRMTPSLHAVQEADWLTTEEANAERDYWVKQTVNLPPTTLPQEPPRSAEVAGPMAAHAPLFAALDVGLTESLHALSREHEVDLADVVQTAIGIALSRYGSTNDVVIGALRARRNAPSARTMGMFANEVMLRFDLKPNATFASAAHHVRSVTTEAADHDRLPLSTLVRAIRETSTTTAMLDRAPFDVSFGWQATGRKSGSAVISALALGIGGVQGEVAGIRVQTRTPRALIAHAPLTFFGALLDDRLHLTATYQPQIVSQWSAQQALDHTMEILRQVASDFEQEVSAIEIFSAEEKFQRGALLDGPFVPETNGTILDRFDAAVDRVPLNRATADVEHSYNYRQASEEVDRIAGLLLERGVGPGDNVGVRAAPSAQVPLTLLAIMRCGAAYVPIDPRYPADRQSYMLTDSGASVVVVDELSDVLPASVTQVPLTTHDQPQPAAASVKPVELTDDAYLMYTSGSTGQPKGVRQTHRMLSNLVEALSDRPGFTQDDCILAIASLSFDISVVELLMPLAVGGAVFVADTDVALDSAALTELIDSSGATVFQATPATWRTLIAADWSRPEVTVWSQAEELTRMVADQLIDRTAAVWNLYGPTETHDCTVAKVDVDASLVSIGSPINNTRLEIVDLDDRSMPIGCRGELIVAGAGVAHGYRGRDDLTAERFIDRHGDRWYRTGDLVTMLADGVLRYDGRIDHQVKLRGHRIELGEIEALLENHGDIAESVVLLQALSADDHRLVAYVVAAEGSTIDQGALYTHLSQSLPGYMIPSAIEVLDSIPKMPNKKTDRSRLPLPDRWARRGSETVVLPRSATERALVRIWGEVLHLVEVSIHDSFFDLGGHSLLATQIASRVRSQLGVDITLRTVYDSPTIAAMAVEVDNASDLETDFTLPVVDTSVPVPLSYSQERMWFLHQLLPEGAGYNMAGALRVRGALDIGALEAAFSDLVVRHEALRTRFVQVDGTPLQVIDDPWTVSIDVVDYTKNPDREAVDAELAAALTQAANRPFLLEELPLVRLCAHRLAVDEHVLFVNMHHIIGDEWTFGILAEEVAACYEARLAGGQFEFEEPAIQHTNFAVWHREWLDTGVISDQLEYWREKLEGVTPVELPTDRPRPRMLSGYGRNIEIDLSTELLASIRSLAAQMRTSPFVVLLAGFKALLHRHTGLTDLTIGSPIANRNTTQSERVISSLVNGVVMRTDIEGCVSFADIVKRVHTTAFDAFANQDMPFEKLVEELQPQRDPSRSPFFQIFFNVLTAPFEAASLAGTTVAEEHIVRGAAQFDLTMTVSINRKKIAVEYSTDLFDHDRIERLLQQYVMLLEAILVDPQDEFGVVDLRSEVERQGLAATWGHDTYVPFNETALLHDLVHAQTTSTPERPAVAGEGLALTYRELDEQANRLANHLIESGIEPGDVVAILVERSAWSAVAMVAINRAGAAFVPLDPEFPTERVQFMLTDSGARGVVTSDSLRSRLRGGDDLLVCSVDTGEHLNAQTAAPEVAMSSTDLAWIMYTSGSTGRPKGIEIEHRSAVNLFTSMAKAPGITPDDVVMSVTSASFDPSIQDVFLPLLNGAMVHIAPQQVLVDGQALKALLEATGASQMFSTPTTWQMLVEVGWQGRPGFSAQSGGEPLPRPLANQLLERSGSVWNLYGLTETTVWSSAHRVEPGEGSVPVGAPIDNTSFHILDRNQQPCAAGIPGELFIGGVGVGRRFRNRPDLDAERIIANPDLTDHHKRLYRTGDLATYDVSGRLFFHGRGDDQVKIRGRRVETAEIELAVASHPGVERAAVVPFSLDDAGTRLAAYVVTSSGQDPSDASLKEHLRRYLPDYMLPVSYTRLDEFPLTPNRKVDRLALPKPVVGRTDAEAWEAPADAIESAIAEVWERHLSYANVGRHDDFFELGGHSLLAIRVFADLEQLTGRLYPVAALFRGPTVAELANVIRSDWQAPFTSLVEVQTQGSKPPFFSVSPFLITTLSYQLLARHLGPDQPVYALQAQGLDGDDPVHQRVEDMAAHYISEMREVQPTGPYLLGGHCAGNWVAMEMATQLQDAGEEVALLVLVDSEPPNVRPPASRVPGYGHLAALVAQVRYFRERGVLQDAVRWQAGLVQEQLRLRSAGGQRQERIAAVRAAHRRAYSTFSATTFDGDAWLIRSEESAEMSHKDWHLRWSELITGDLLVREVPGVHSALMLQEESTIVLATHLSQALASVQADSVPA